MSLSVVEEKGRQEEQRTDLVVVPHVVAPGGAGGLEGDLLDPVVPHVAVALLVAVERVAEVVVAAGGAGGLAGRGAARVGRVVREHRDVHPRARVPPRVVVPANNTPPKCVKMFMREEEERERRRKKKKEEGRRREEKVGQVF